jgi:hypothetical protein
MEAMQKRLDEIAAQPAPHVLLRVVSKAEETKANGASEQAWITRVPYSKLVKFADGVTVDWKRSAEVLTPADAI